MSVCVQVRARICVYVSACVSRARVCMCVCVNWMCTHVCALTCVCARIGAHLQAGNQQRKYEFAWQRVYQRAGVCVAG